MKNLGIGTLLLALFLAGCADKVSTVKAAPALADGYTNEQILDHDPNCSKTNWEVIKDDKGRELVEYTCFIQFSQERRDAFKASALKAAQSRVQQHHGFYTYARTEAERRATEGAYQREIQGAQKRVEEMQREPDYSQNYPAEGVGPISGQKVTKMQMALEWLEKYKSEAAAYQAKAAPIMQQIVEFEEPYGMALTKAEEEDAKTLETYFDQDFKMERRAYFLVKDKEVTRVGNDFVVNGHSLQLGNGQFEQLLRTQEFPDRQKDAWLFWSIQLPQPKLAIHTFPYNCDANVGCEDKSKR